MRSLIISIIAFACIITPWGIFMAHADKNINNMAEITKNELMAEVDNEDWKSAEKTFNRISDKWYSDRKAYSIFMSSQSIENVESGLLKSEAYIRSRERSSALGELAYFRHQLLFMLENEKITLENIM